MKHLGGAIDTYIKTAAVFLHEKFNTVTWMINQLDLQKEQLRQFV